MNFRKLKMFVLPVVLIAVLVTGYFIFRQPTEMDYGYLDDYLVGRMPAPRPPDPDATAYFDDIRMANAFYDSLIDITQPLAEKEGYEYSGDDHERWLIQMPETFSAGSLDPAERYLAGKLEESKELGYDFSPLAGQIATCRIQYYLKLGEKPIVYIALGYRDGSVAGVWKDDYKAASEKALHWSSLDFRTK